MPMHFDRFRLLNDTKRLKNESDKPIYVRAEEADPPIEVLPGQEVELPISPAGETLLEVPHEE